VLATLAESVRRIAILIGAFLPQTSVRIFEQLGLPAEGLLSEAAFSSKLAGRTISAPQPLFPRFEAEKV